MQTKLDKFFEPTLFILQNYMFLRRSIPNYVTDISKVLNEIQKLVRNWYILQNKIFLFVVS